MIRDFAEVIAALAVEPGVRKGRMFGTDALKVGKRVFAMERRGQLVIKVSAKRAAELRDAGTAEAFDPGHGRVMKEWVAVSPEEKVDWVQLSREALDFVRG